MQVEKIDVFAIPVVKIQLPESESLKQQYLPEILKRYEAGDFKKPVFWETDRVHSSFETPLKDAVIKSIPHPYENLIRNYIRVETIRVNVWHNVYWKNEEYQEIHHHIPFHISLIHFLAFDRAEHEAPVFYDPARQIKAYIGNDAIPKPFYPEKVQFEVNEGDVLIFPSYLEHRVPAGKYKNPRVTVSMNVILS